MRLDKFLAVSRLIKRRTIAQQACDAGRVLVNGNAAKSSRDIKPGDELEIGFGYQSRPSSDRASADRQRSKRTGRSPLHTARHLRLAPR